MWSKYLIDFQGKYKYLSENCFSKKCKIYLKTCMTRCNPKGRENIFPFSHAKILLVCCKHNCGFQTMNCKSLYPGSYTALLIKIGIIIINTFLPIRHVCLSLKPKTPYFGIQRTLGKHFMPPVAVEAYSLQKKLSKSLKKC